MGTVPGLAGGIARGQDLMGVPVVAGKAGFNQFSPTSGIPRSPISGGPRNTMAPLPPGVTGTNQVLNAPLGSPIGGIQAYGAPSNPMAGTVPQSTATAPTAASAPAGTTQTQNPTLAGLSPEQTQQIQKQLKDTLGKGEGDLIFQLLSNLGGDTGSYMDAFHKAMAQTQAQGLATIDTSLGNAGISSDSSTAAIEKGTYLSGLGAQEGLQAQQLIQRQQEEAINIAQNLQQPMAAEASSSWLTTLAQVADVGATLAGNSGAASSLGSMFGNRGAGAVAPLQVGGADPLNLSGGIPSLPGAGGLSMPGMTSMGMAGGIPMDI